MFAHGYLYQEQKWSLEAIGGYGRLCLNALPFLWSSSDQTFVDWLYTSVAYDGRVTFA